MVNQQKVLEASNSQDEIFSKTYEDYELSPQAEKVACFDLVAGKALSEYDTAMRVGEETAKKVAPYGEQMKALREVFTRHSIYSLQSEDIKNINQFFISYMLKRKDAYKNGGLTDDMTTEYYNACLGLSYVKGLWNEKGDGSKDIGVTTTVNFNGRSGQTTRFDAADNDSKPKQRGGPTRRQRPERFSIRSSNTLVEDLIEELE